MTWTSAIVRGLLIVAYFVITTVWLPDKVSAIDAVEAASGPVRELTVAGVWAAAFGGGIWLLRIAQRRRHI